MSCNYTYPTGDEIKKVFWTKTLVKNGSKESSEEGEQHTDLSEDPEYSQRLQYLGDKQQKLHHQIESYPPRNVSVSISSSGVIVEGDSVTLICSSDSNPPAEMSWFKGGTFVGSGRIYSISNISSDHSGEYKCKSRNKHGEKDSDTVTLNVMYSPKNVSVSVNGSGEIVEGDSVTLICSSDSNPPALNFSWFKGEMFVGSGRIYSISNISSDDSKKYKCKSINEHGEKYSDAVNLNVMYAPRNVSVLISGSGGIAEGDSVTLICSSDSNPPAEIIWFKENQSSSVGSGQSFSALQSGRFYCEAHNQHGSQRSDAVTVTVKGGDKTVLYAAVVIPAGCGVLFLICIIMFMFIRKRKSGYDIRQKQVQHPPSSETNYSDDGLYARISAKRPSADQTIGKTIKTVYTMIQHVKNNESNGNLTVHHPDPAVGSDAMVDESVVYSKVK
ncbi:B-cell receptor CD22-like [Carassius auratus]|uniref:B-cell receptor CD22-like n=1 Tax=Carassius auratus TaxID=7957 RepID=A0A6P6NJ83_CARAU|nr:B-cell receptor CD22-like [Carassius auratus]